MLRVTEAVSGIGADVAARAGERGMLKVLFDAGRGFAWATGICR
ncbi:hypothetical protein [Undibacterium sp. WLX3042]